VCPYKFEVFNWLELSLSFLCNVQAMMQDHLKERENFARIMNSTTCLKRLYHNFCFQSGVSIDLHLFIVCSFCSPHYLNSNTLYGAFNARQSVEKVWSIGIRHALFLFTVWAQLRDVRFMVLSVGRCFIGEMGPSISGQQRWNLHARPVVVATLGGRRIAFYENKTMHT